MNETNSEPEVTFIYFMQSYHGLLNVSYFFQIGCNHFRVLLFCSIISLYMSKILNLLDICLLKPTCISSSLGKKAGLSWSNSKKVATYLKLVWHILVGFYPNALWSRESLKSILKFLFVCLYLVASLVGADNSWKKHHTMLHEGIRTF